MVIAMITGTMSPASAAVTTQTLDVPLTGTFSIAGSGTFTLSGAAHLVIIQYPGDPIRPAVTRIQTNLVNAVANNGPPIRPVTGAASIDLAPASTQTFTLTYQFQPGDPIQPGDPVRPVSIRYHLQFASDGTITESTATAVGTF
jgi:hypothetical protein